MNTPIIHKIADTPPEFPCWIYRPKSFMGRRCWYFATNASWVAERDTHWCHSDICPPVTPEVEDETDNIRRLANEGDLTFSEAKYLLQRDANASSQLPADALRELQGKTYLTLCNLEDIVAKAESRLLAGDPNGALSQLRHAAQVSDDFARLQLTFQKTAHRTTGADVEKVAEEIADRLDEIYGDYFSRYTTPRLSDTRALVAAILRRRDADKDAEIVRLHEVVEATIRLCHAAEKRRDEEFARAEKAEAELAELKDKWQEATKSDAIVKMSLERDTLRAQLAASEQRLKEALEDSKRLDWLDEQSTPITRTEKPGWKGRAWDIESDEGTSLRATIDAVRTTS